MVTRAVLALLPVAERVAAIARSWKDLYDESTVIAVAVVFAHLAALLVGGGLALASDWAMLRAASGTPEERERQLAQLGRAHRAVVGALALVAGSGALLFLADVEAHAASNVFWAKMALVVVLLLNGLRMTRLERAARRWAAGALGGGADRGRAVWAGLRTSAVVSAALWLATLLAGVILTNA